MVKIGKIMAMIGLGLCVGTTGQAADRRMVLIGSGEVSGFYYPAAGAICRVFNKDRPHGNGCAVVPSSGSAANVAALRAGEVDFALVQSRAAFAAVNGTEGFSESGPFADLRGVLSLHGESALILARPGSGIEQMSDLKGKRVNLGRPGSFQRMMADVALEAAGMSEGDLSPAVEMDLAEQGGELCDGNIDAAFFSGVHPMPEAAEAMDRCDAVAVPLKSKGLDAYLKANAWLYRGTIKRETYDAQKDDIPTVQMRALLVTTTRQSAEDVTDLLKSIQGNFAPFTHLHPVLNGLGKAEMVKDPMPVRRHDAVDKPAEGSK